MNCDDTLDWDQSPMSNFARVEEMKTPVFSGGLTVNLWGFGNAGLSARDVVVWIVGRLFEQGRSEELELPIDEDDPDLIAVVEQLLISRMRGGRVFIIIDGLALFEDGSEVPNKHDFENMIEANIADIKSMVTKDLSAVKDTESAKKAEPSKKTASKSGVEPKKKATGSKQPETKEKAEPSKKPMVWALKQAIDSKKQSEAQQPKGKAKATDSTEPEGENPNELLSRLVNTLIGVAKREREPGQSPLKLLFINPMRSDIMAAVETANPDIPVLTVPTAKEFEVMYPGGVFTRGGQPVGPFTLL